MSNFNIVSSSLISRNFTDRKINSFQEACVYIRELPYKRNSDKSNPICVFNDGAGTCSTKHALLKQLADENSMHNVKLMLGIFEMKGSNTPSMKSVLDRYNLNYIPEAHNYLYVDGKIVDCTKNGFNINNFKSDLIKEIEITPSQITDFKVKYHQDFLHNWLNEERTINLSYNELWAIREECIEALSK